MERRDISKLTMVEVASQIEKVRVEIRDLKEYLRKLWGVLNRELDPELLSPNRAPRGKKTRNIPAKKIKLKARRPMPKTAPEPVDQSALKNEKLVTSGWNALPWYMTRYHLSAEDSLSRVPETLKRYAKKNGLTLTDEEIVTVIETLRLKLDKDGSVLTNVADKIVLFDQVKQDGN